MLAALPRILFARPLGRGRVRDVIATVVVATVVVGGASLIPGTTTTTPPVSPPGVDVWVSTTGNDSTCARGNQSAPCRTLQRAYQIAQLGDEVEIAGGSYSNENWTSANPKSGSGRVTFRPASGQTPVFGQVRPELANHIVFEDFTIDNLFMHLSEDIILNDMSLRIWFSRGGKDLTMNGGSVSTSQNGDSPTIGKYSGERESQNIVFDGVYFHDIGRQSCSGCHVECLFVQEATNVTIKNSRFERCDIMNIYVSGQGLGSGGSGNVTNLTIENNWFASPTDGGSNALRMNPDTATIVSPNIRNNSFSGGSVSFDPAGTYTNAKFSGNIGNMAGGVCPPSGWTSRFNVFGPGNDLCGTGDQLSSNFGYVNPPTNLHITSGSPARNSGDPTNFPATDYDGEPRSQGTVDAGADEIS